MVWALPEARAKFGKEGLRSIQTSGDLFLTTLGVSTRLVVYTGKSMTRGLADGLGKLVVLGEKDSAIAAARAAGLVTAADADWFAKSWDPEGNNPEKSDFNAAGKGQYTFVDSNACYAFSRLVEGAARPSEAAALFAIHGVGTRRGSLIPRRATSTTTGPVSSQCSPGRCTPTRASACI